MPSWIAFAAVFAVALVISVVVTPLVGKLGELAGLVDAPRENELGRRVTPRIGGYAMVAAVVAALLTAILVVERTPDEYPRIIGLLLGIGVLLPIAAIDDARRLGPLPQLAGQVGVAISPIIFGVMFDNVSLPWAGMVDIPIAIAIPLTLLWIVGMINTMNFIDTMDGLAAGIGLIDSSVLFIVAFTLGQVSVAALPLALAGATLGFLFFNFHPARIFMGTSGSMLIGYLLAVLSIIGGVKLATAAMVLGIPILDVAIVIITRLASGRSPFKGGDSAHLPHRLLKAGFSQRQVALLLYLLCLFFGGLAVALDREQKVAALAVMVAIAIGLIVVATLRGRRTPAAESISTRTQ